MRKLLFLFLAALLISVAAAPLNHAASDVAFVGDSLTQGWSFPRSNLGIYGQTTSQMLARFPASIAQRHYRKVFVLGGTNDALLGMDPGRTVANLSEMVDLAREEGAAPVLAEIPPIFRENGRYLPAVRQLNLAILRLGAAKGVPVIDYYDALAGHPDAYSDGTHLKRRGYLRMEYALLLRVSPF